MKLNEILTEAISFGGMQKKVYDFVIKKMKMNSSTEDYVRELARSTDTFWVSSFDDLLKEFERVRSIDRIEDAIWNAIVDVNEAIVDYMGDAANHPDGYEVQKLKTLEDSDVSMKDMVALINDIDNTVAATLKKMADEENAEARARSAKAVASAKEHFDEIVTIVKKHDAKGWSEFLKITKNVKTEKDFNISFAIGTFNAFQKQDIKTVDALKAYVKSFGDKEYVHAIVDNMYNINLPKEDSMVMNHLYAINSNASLRKKFFALVN